MSKEAIMQRVAALEKRLEAGTQSSPKVSLAAEIEALEKRLADCMGDSADEPSLDDLEMELEAGDKTTVKASLADPSGIEEEITQDRFTEVEGERHGEELASADSALAVGEESPTKPTGAGYVARLMKASERLDRVADYLEKNGRRTLAEKVDRIADAVDAKISNIKGRK